MSRATKNKDSNVFILVDSEKCMCTDHTAEIFFFCRYCVVAYYCVCSKISVWHEKLLIVSVIATVYHIEIDPNSKYYRVYFDV